MQARLLIVPASTLGTQVAPTASSGPALVQVRVAPVTTWPGASADGSPPNIGDMSALSMSVSTLLRQAGGGTSSHVEHCGSPPPLTPAMLLTLGIAARVGVTLMVKVTELPTVNAACSAVQVTCWTRIVQPAPPVAELMVRPAGTLSMTMASAVALAAPVLVTVMV